jgi:site-specific recombinase XerC
MHQLTYELKHLVDTHREGSYATQANRKAMLLMMGNQLVAAGYRHLTPDGLKGRHVNALIAQWKTEAISHNTIRNRLAALRWWAARVHNPGALPPDNAHYDLTPRETRTTTSKARLLPTEKLPQVRDRYVRMSLELQREFGLRREESIKIKPHQADRGNRLVLQGSWTKGGRPREIPITTLAQREALDRATLLAKRGALIPPSKSYAQQLHRYEHWTRKAGLSHMHGLRHAWAEKRFAELAGFPCPASGGPTHAELTPAQRVIDVEVREILSEELGHARERITAAYLGR